MNCKNIVLNKNYWYVKLYLLSTRIWCGFSGIYYTENQALKTNLCSFLQTIFLKMPFVLFSYAFALSTLFTMAFIIPIYLYGAPHVVTLYTISCFLLLIGHIIVSTFKYIKSFFVTLEDNEYEPLIHIDEEISVSAILDSYTMQFPSPTFSEIIQLSIEEYFDNKSDYRT